MRAVIVAPAALLVAGAFLAMVVWGLSNTRGVLRPVSYWIVDDRTIGVMVLDSRPDNSCAVRHVEEAPETIRIMAECPEAWLSTGSTGAAYRYPFTVELRDDLADRIVVDGAGHVAERCRLPGCE